VFYFFSIIGLLLGAGVFSVSAAVVDLSQITPATQGAKTSRPAMNQPAVQSAVPPTASSSSEIELGQEIVRGVIAQARLVPLQGQMPASEVRPAKVNYRLVVTFREAKSGREILTGQAAVRLFAEDDRTLDTIRLVLEQQAWSCLLFLPDRSETMIKVGSQLDDGKKRIFRFFFDRERQLSRKTESQRQG
jgi:hypothetical protein